MNQKHIIVRILNYGIIFLLDTENFSFIIFKGLYHTSFKLNIVNFSRALPPWSPTEPTEGSQCTQTPSCALFPIDAKRRFFFLPG